MMHDLLGINAEDGTPEAGSRGSCAGLVPTDDGECGPGSVLGTGGFLIAAAIALFMVGSILWNDRAHASAPMVT